MSIALLLFLLLGASLLVSSFVRPRYFLFLCGLVIPLISIRLAVGIGVDWYKVIGPLAIGLAFFARRRGGIPRPVHRLGWPVAYAFLLSAVWMVLEYNVLQRYYAAAALGLGEGQAYYKMPVQIGSFIGQALTIYVIPLRAASVTDVRWGIAGYVWGCLGSTLVGVLSWVAGGGGTLLRPERTLTVVVEQTQINRIGGLSGEPKFLGACLALLVVYGLARYVFGPGRAGRPLLAASLVAVFLTLSTSAWAGIAAAIGLAVGLRLTVLRRGRMDRLLVLVGGLVLLGTASTVGSALLQGRLWDRLVGEGSELGKQKDMYVLWAFRDQPLHALWGFGLGGGDLEYMPYITRDQQFYTRTPTPGTTGMRLLGDLGLIGMLLLGWTVLSWSRHLRRSGDAAGAAFVLLGFAAMMLMSMVSLTAYLFLVGGLLAQASIVAMPATPSALQTKEGAGPRSRRRVARAIP